MVTKVESISKPPQLSFWTCLRPLFVWFKITGLDLPTDDLISSDLSRWGSHHIYALFCFALNIAVNTLTALNFTELAGFWGKFTCHGGDSDSWNIYIFLGSNVCVTASVHFFWLLVLRRRWPHMRNCFNQMEHSVRPDTKLYYQFRYLAFGGIFCTILLV